MLRLSERTRKIRHIPKVLYVEPARDSPNVTFDPVVHGGGLSTAGAAAVKEALMHDFQDALYISVEVPWNAVIFDREWIEASLRINLDSGVVRAVSPSLRGFQWLLHIRRLSAGESVVPLPEDRAPFGRLPTPIPIMSPSMVGRWQARRTSWSRPLVAWRRCTQAALGD